MEIFKRLWGTIIWFAIIGSFFWLFSGDSRLSICSRPLEYSIGNVDTRFGVSRDTLISLTKSAEKIWEDAVGKDLYNYVEGADFKINMVYGAAQENNAKLAEYNRDMDAYNSRLARHNENVDYWNARGGAPEDAFNGLEAEARILRGISADLDARSLLIHDFEETAGMFDGEKIDIYMTLTLVDLKMTLAHELGHAIIEDHSSNDHSIMYYKDEGVPASDLVITQDDIDIVNEVCEF